MQAEPNATVSNATAWMKKAKICIKLTQLELHLKLLRVKIENLSAEVSLVHQQNAL